MSNKNITQTNVVSDNLKDLKNRHLQIGRSDKMNAITRIRATLLKSAREFFDQDGWLEISPIPAISSLSGACEDFSTLFSVDYFRKRAFLIQTGQQHLEPFIYGSIPKVYAFNQSYRKETKAPKRRLTAFLLIEAEAANYTLADIQDVQERLIYKLCNDVLLQRTDDLILLKSDLSRLKLKLPFERMQYTDAIERLKKMKYTIQMGADLESKHEKALGKKKMGQPFFVSHYPAVIKFFNMKNDPKDSNLVLSSDLLLPGYGEAIGSSQREDDYEKLVEKLEEFGKDKDRVKDMKKIGIKGGKELKKIYKWYLELRRGHQVPHSGFGLGFERLVQWICGLDSIIEATEYPKTKAYLLP
jgi:asparaginyl-tRNA synthetase